MQLTEDAKSDWRWIINNLEKVNGARIWRPSRIIIVSSDASNDGWGGDCLGQKAAGQFTREEAGWHIMFKEMLGMVLTLQSFSGMLRGKRLLLRNDNMTVVAYLQNGGGTWRDLNLMVKEIFRYVMEDLESEVVGVEWIKGNTDNILADALSREVDLDDWMISQAWFNKLQQRWACTVDRFADDLNKRLPRFNSRFWCPGAEAVDAFRQDWVGELNWLCPPLGILHRVVRQVVEQGAVGVLVVPRWEAQPWWPMLKGIIVEGVQLGPAEDVFVKGLSGCMEPAKSRTWEFWAVLVDGKRVSHWTSE